MEEPHSNQDAHYRARHQERGDDNRLRDQMMDPDEEGCRMESTRRVSEIEESDRERNSRDHDIGIGAGCVTPRTLRGDIVPKQRSTYRSWTLNRSPLRTGCDIGDVRPKEDQGGLLDKGQSQTFKLDARVNELPPSADISQSMMTRSRTLDPQGLITLDCSLTKGTASNISTPAQFDTSKAVTIERLTGLTGSGGPKPYTAEDFMAPLLTDGEGREAYTPWGHRDMATLANHDPSSPSRIGNNSIPIRGCPRDFGALPPFSTPA